MPIAVIEPDEFQLVVQNPDLLFQRQVVCPDFQEMIAYLINGDLPDNKKQREKLVAESQYYSTGDGVLYHLFQRRLRKPEPELNVTYQIALPRVLREPALRCYHDSSLFPKVRSPQL